MVGTNRASPAGATPASAWQATAADKRYFFVFCGILAAVVSTFAAGTWSSYRGELAVTSSEAPSSGLAPSDTTPSRAVSSETVSSSKTASFKKTLSSSMLTAYSVVAQEDELAAVDR